MAVKKQVIRMMTYLDGGDEIKTPLDKVCKDCDGVGIVANPEWQGWFAAYTEAAFLREHPEPTGPEEEACGECEGVGMVPTETGAAILALISRYREGGN